MLMLFGGSFNPPHIGHRIIAEIAYDEFKPNRFLIVPSKNPPHKSIDFIANFDKRFSWCERVFFEHYFEVSDIESKLPSPSYTIRTIEYLTNFDKNIYLLIGEDSFKNFHKWYKWEEILKKVKLVVYPRYFEEKDSYSVDFEYVKLESPIVEISSTDIRQRIKKKKTVKGLIDDKIIGEVLKEYS